MIIYKDTYDEDIKEAANRVAPLSRSNRGTINEKHTTWGAYLGNEDDLEYLKMCLKFDIETTTPEGINKDNIVSLIDNCDTVDKLRRIGIVCSFNSNNQVVILFDPSLNKTGRNLYDIIYDVDVIKFGDVVILTPIRLSDVLADENVAAFVYGNSIIHKSELKTAYKRDDTRTVYWRNSECD